MQRVTLPWSAASVTSFVWLADSSALLVGLDDGDVALWSPVTGGERDRLGCGGGAVTALARSDDGKLLATGGADGQVRVWDLGEIGDGTISRARCVATHRLADAARTLAWSASGRRLAAASASGALLGLDREDLAAPCFELERPAGDAEVLVWETDNSLWGGGQGFHLLWLQGADVERNPLKTGGHVLAAAHNHEERLMLVGLASGEVRDNPGGSDRVLADAGRRVLCWASATARAYNLLCHGARDGRIGVHLHTRGAAAAPACASFAAHDGPVTALACAASGLALVSRGDDGAVHVWSQGEVAAVVTPDKQPYERWSSASRSGAGVVALVHPLALTLLGDDVRISVSDDNDWGGYGDAVWSPYDDTLISVDDEHATLRRYDRTGRQLALLAHAPGFAGGLACAGDGLVAVASRDYRVRILGPSFAVLADIEVAGEVGSLAWSGTGLLAALAGSDLQVLADHGARVCLELETAAWSDHRHQLAWTPDGSHLAVGGDALLIVDVASGAALRRPVCALSPAFSPDGRWLAVYTPPQTVVVWDWRAGRAVAFWQRTPSPDANTIPLRLVWRDERTLLLVGEHAVVAWTIDPFAGPAADQSQ